MVAKALPGPFCFTLGGALIPRSSVPGFFEYKDRRTRRTAVTKLLRAWRPSLLLASALHLSSCTSAGVDRYADKQPRLIMEDFFSGQLTAHGVVKNRSGDVIRYFNADICAQWSTDGKGTLEELFVFDDGERQTRTWVLVPAGVNRYEAQANDVVGTSTATLAGNALFLDYVLQIPYRKRIIDVGVHDRMYLVNPNIIINESTLHKWGFHVGTVILTITKDTDDAC